MTKEISLKTNLIEISIGNGWTAFYSASEKKVYGITEFKNGSKAKTSLLVITKASEQELMAEISSLGLVYTAPVIKPSI
jgi:hypothetical protein